MNQQHLADAEVGFGAPSAGSSKPNETFLTDAEAGFGPPSRGFKGWAGDALGVAARGAIAVPEAVVGLADIASGGHVGKALENEGGTVGLRFKQAKDAASDLFDSDATKQQNQEFQKADGIVEKAKVALSNPSMVVRAVGESIPSMLAGGVAARGVQLATKLGPVSAGAIGEGVTAAGSQAEQIRQETTDGLLTPTQSALAGATGLATTAFGAAGGRVAQRLGIGDAETLLAQGAKGVASKNADDAARAATNPLLAQAPKSVPRSVIEGAISEGLLEELPQSLAEQLFQNLALDKPWDTDLDGAAVMGVLSGGAMGAGAAGYSAATRPRAAAAPGQEASAPGAEAVPAAPGLELAPMGGDLPAQGADVRDTPLAEQSAMDSVRTTFDPRAGTQPAPGLLPQADPNGIPFEAEQPAPAQIDTGNLALDDGAAPRALGYNPLAGTPTVFADGSVALNGDQEFEARTGVNPTTMRPSQAMGLDPAAGSMSAAAALAVDSGATQQMAANEAAAQAAQQQQAAASQAQQARAQEQAAAEKATAAREQAGEKAARAGQARLDMTTGDLLEPASISNLTGQQLTETYLAARKPETRRVLEKELVKRASKAEAPAQAAAPAPAAAPAAAPAPAPAAEANLSARERAGLASTIAGRELADQPLSPELAGLQAQLAQVQQRATANGSWNVPLMAQRRRIEDAIAKLQPATTEGEASGPETAQAEQDRAQPPQSAAAPAVAPAAPAAPDAEGSGGPQSAGPAGVADGGTTTANAGAQAAPAPGAPAQAPSGEVEALRQQLRDVEAKILQAAPAAVGQGGGDIEAAMKSRKVPVPLKAQRQKLQDQLRAAQDKGQQAVAEKGQEASAAPPAAPARKPRGILAKKAAAEEQARADYFAPGNIVKSYGGHDRVVAFTPSVDGSPWSVTVQAVRKEGDGWVDVPNERERVHATLPDAKDLKAGPVARARATPAPEPEATAAPAPAAAPAPEPSKPEGIQDFGEKIGGARKDRADAGAPKAAARPRSTDERPAWARRFEVSQIVKSSRPGEDGRWTVRDNRSKDALGQSRRVGERSYATQEEAEQAVPLIAVSQKHRPLGSRQGDGSVYEIWRDVTDRKRVKVVDQVFPTREAALEYMVEHAQEIIETNTTFGEADLPRPDSEVRVGEARRTGDARDSDFTSVFGFRGVEFGNWNNQAERQQLLNDAYDGLLDLAEVMSIPPRAISLNGELALAFGARGHGLSGARAHYETDKAVINLTKMNGAGSLAHEWFHALDHYLGRQDGKASAQWVVGKDGTRSLQVSSDPGRDMASGGTRGERSGMRAELQEALGHVMRTMSRKAEQYLEDGAKADKFVAATRAEVKERLDGIRKDLARQLDPRYYTRLNKPATAEQLAQFDAVAEKIVAGELLDLQVESKKGGRSVLSGVRWTNDALNQLSGIMKAVRGRQGFTADHDGPLDRVRGSMQLYSARLKMLADAQASSEKTRMVPTRFAMDATELDQGRGKDYWTTPYEMAARAFQGYVEDKIAERGGKSPFLNHAPENAVIETPWGWKRPYPAGDERRAINAAFDKLVATVQTREQEGGGVALFRREADEATTFDTAGFLATMARSPFSEAARAQAVQSVQATVDAARAAWGPNAPQVVVAFDMQDPAVPEAARRADLRQRSGGARGAPEGFYYRGKAYLMASRLGTPNDAARVLFHEVLGHHGLRGKFGRELDQVLNQIATMRKPEVAAKLREYGLRGVDSLGVREAAEEVLAEMAEKTPQLHFVRRAVSAIRNWLRANVPGFQSLRLTDSDIIQAYILPARGWVERGGQSDDAAEPAVASLPALAFSLAPSALEQARARWAGLVDQFVRGGLDETKTHEVLPSSTAVMSMVGLPDLPVRVGGHGLDALYNHGVKPSQMKRMLDELADPRMVMIWNKGSRGEMSLNFVTSMSNDKGEPFIIAIRPNKGGREGPHHYVATITEKQPRAILDMVREGGALYVGDGEIAGIEAKEMREALRFAKEKRGKEARDLVQAIGTKDSLPNLVQRVLYAKDLAAFKGAADVQGGDAPVFSRARAQDIAASALDQLQQTMSYAGKVSLWDKTVGTMRHLAERAPAFKPVYEAAQRFIDDVSMLGNDAADRAPRLLPRVETLADLKKKPITAADNKAIARPLFEGTLLWGRDVDGKAVPVDDLTKKYGSLPAADKAQLLLRAGRIEPNVLQMWQGLPVGQFEAAVNTRFEGQMLRPGVAWKAQELADLFGLTPQQVSLYQEARSAIDRSIDMTARADMLRAVGSEYASMRELVLEQDSLEDAMKVLTDTLQADARENPDRAERLLGLNNAVVKSAERAQELQAAGYAPLSRFGRYTVDVVGQNGEREYFGMFETMREANQMRMRMASAFPGATVTSGTMSQEAFKLFQGITPESLEQFGGMLGLSSTGDEAKDKAFQAYLQLAKNNHSALKRLIHRKGISGYSEDVGRVLASFVYSNARLAAGGLNAGTLETAIEGIPKEQGELRDVAMGLRSYIQDPQEEGQAVRGMLFAQYLGGSVASALVNMTQPFQITMPWLSQFGGMRKAGTQLAAAVRDMARGGRGYEPDLVRALQAAEDDGVVSPQEIHQLMAQARGAGSLRTGDGTRAGDARAAAANNWERVKVAWGQPFALAEQFNRRSTFIAAYRLAKDQGMDAPAEFARRAVLETQFVYSKANKPRWARGAIGGTLFTFKTYSVSYLELMQRMWTQGGPEGKRAVGWALAMLMLMGGAGGLPFVEDLEDLIDGAGQLMGYNLSSKQWRKQAMRDAVGKELADFVENGVSGLPGAPIDISGRLGMGNLLPGTGLLLSKQNRERDLLEVAGPAGDLVARGFTGARKALTGDLAGAALEVSPAAVRNAVKGADMATSGIYKDTKGYKVIDTTLDEALAKAIGFQPRSVAEVQESNSAMQRAKSFYTQTSSEIKAQWADALFRKDEADLQRVRERLAAWNRDNPDQPITVKMPDIWKRVREMGKDRTERIADTAPKALRQQMREMARDG